MFVRLHHRDQRRQREVPVEDVEVYLSVMEPRQINDVAASQAAALIPCLPAKHRKVMELLIDGANPLEISDETGNPITTVLAIIREARLWLSDGGCYLWRVAPIGA